MQEPDQNLPGRVRSAVGSVCGLIVAGLLASGGPGWTAEPKWPGGTYNYLVVNQSVRDALIEFGRNVGVSVQMSENIKGRLHGGVPQGSAREFLDWICNRYGLVWYFDGSAIHISNETENRTEVVKLDDDALSGLGERLDSLGIVDPRFPVTISHEERAASISGPPTYIALIKQTIATFGRPAVQPVADRPAKVRVFRGRQVEAQSVVIEDPADTEGK